MFLRCSTTMMPYLRLADSVVRPGAGLGRQLLIGLRASQRYSTAENVNKDVTTGSTGTVATSSGSPTAKTTSKGSLTDHRVNKLEKLFLVWGGKYKSMKEVPDLVSQGVLERARNKARIKINISMAVATLFGCLIMVISGKKAQKEGSSVVKMNEEWHKRINEEAQRKEEAKLAAAAK